jgi:hypothetical protein
MVDDLLQVVFVVGKDEADTGYSVFDQAIQVGRHGGVGPRDIGDRHKGLDREILISGAGEVLPGVSRPFLQSRAIASLNEVVAQGEGRLVAFLGNHGQQHIGADGLAVRLRGGLQLFVQAAEIGQAVVLAAEKTIVRVLRRELDAAVGLAGANDRNIPRRLRQRLAVVQLEEATFVRRPARAPQLAQHLEVFGRIVVAIAEILVTPPQAHLQVFELIPARDDVHAEPAVADVVDRRRHLGDDRRVHGRDGDRGVELDARRHRRHRRHQREGFEGVVPVVGDAAEAAPFDHGEQEVEPRGLGDQGVLLVEFPGREILRRRLGRHDGAAFGVGQEDSEFEGTRHRATIFRGVSCNRGRSCKELAKGK